VLVLVGRTGRKERDPARTGGGAGCVRTHWIRGFMALQLARRTRTVLLMVPV
jgi:hypothetical protein